MTSNLLRTKLFIPEPRESYIVRSNLLEQLDVSQSRKLTLVAAPPGYGKSTLLSIWFKERGIHGAWLSLDTEDSDSNIFIRYLIASLQIINPQVGQVSLALLKSTQTSSSSSILSALLNDLSQIDQDITLVLDDYHSVENAEVHESVSFLLDHLTPNVHILISSRSDPPLPLSRLRARNQLLEIRQEDLRLSPEEAQQFMNKSMGLALTEDQINSLESRTEGWIAGLQFAGLSLRKQEDIETFIVSFSGSHRFIIDYLADEIYSNQTEEMQTFLSQIAILDRFSGPLCDRLTERQDSRRLIDHLDKNNLFLIPLDEQRTWYRFHHLFLDYLRAQLTDQDQAKLHRIAAEWFMTNQLHSEAVKHASASGDKNLLINAISYAAQRSFEAGEIDSISTWLAYLSDQELMQNSQLATYRGLINFVSINPTEAFEYAQAAQDNLPPDASSSVQGQLMCLQAHVSLFQGDLDRSIRYSRDALEYLDPDDLFFRNLTLNILGQILEIKGDVAGAAEIYQQAIISSQKADDRLGTLVIFTNLIFALNELGKRTQALGLCQEFAADPKWSNTEGLDLSDGIYLPWSLLSYEANQLELAQEQIHRTLKGLELVNIAQGKLWAQYIQGSIYLANQDFDLLADVSAHGRHLANQFGSNTLHHAWFEMLEAQADLIQGNIAEVERWAESRNFSPQDTPQHWFEQQYFTFIRLLITQDHLADARLLLESVQESAQAGKRNRKLITIHLLLARIESACNQQEEVLDHLKSALELAVPQDYRRAFFDEGPAIIELLTRVREFAPDFIGNLTGDPTAHGPASPTTIHDYESLSERELEILRLVARGYSNRQIAEALFITLGTVKKHLNNVFGKLQVSNRTQAVLRAKELELLG